MLKRTIIINGVKTTLVAEAEEKLSDVLRKQLGLTGTKVGCGSGECSTCTVILNNKLVRACITNSTFAHRFQRLIHL
jgi:aldehyde oxidoreductase